MFALDGQALHSEEISAFFLRFIVKIEVNA